jgi:hypothetical protein
MFRLKDSITARRIFEQFICGAYRAAYQFSTAIGAFALKQPFRAISAEGAFKATYSRFRRIYRDIAVAAFTVRSET